MESAATAAAGHPFQPAVRRNVRAGGATMVTSHVYSSTLAHTIKGYNTEWGHALIWHTMRHNGFPFAFAFPHTVSYSTTGGGHMHAMLSLSCPLLHHTLVTLQHCSTKIS